MSGPTHERLVVAIASSRLLRRAGAGQTLFVLTALSLRPVSLDCKAVVVETNSDRYLGHPAERVCER